ncbi:hypothetical protein ADEAN_000242800 [Angomonas deanei]|uniref:Uncharacterized protein n=1 Tax=Angomonas deanei TaxID=59799 RepID=A0A7G2C689_9TRYP|nr:hypothetical protein ADEAN_000242800 [Angomonas deanei]
MLKKLVKKHFQSGEGRKKSKTVKGSSEGVTEETHPTPLLEKERIPDVEAYSPSGPQSRVGSPLYPFPLEKVFHCTSEEEEGSGSWKFPWSPVKVQWCSYCNRERPQPSAFSKHTDPAESETESNEGSGPYCRCYVTIRPTKRATPGKQIDTCDGVVCANSLNSSSLDELSVAYVGPLTVTALQNHLRSNTPNTSSSCFGETNDARSVVSWMREQQEPCCLDEPVS